MRIETKKRISEEEWLYLTEWREHVFPEEGSCKEWSPLFFHAIAYSKEGDPVGHIGFDGFEILAASTRRFVIGVGGVVVRPEHQGKGISSLLFNEVHARAISILGKGIFTLFCPARLVHYYENQGYLRYRGTIRIRQYGRQVPPTFEFMYRDNIALDGPVELQCEPW